ncbi:MAG: potassium/proton antiporter [Marinifilaceae bacterium]
MTINAQNILLLGSILLFVSILVSKPGYRLGIPVLLLFLFVGMIFGSDGIGVEFHSMHDAQFIGMVALNIILFTGGMDTKFREIKPVLTQGILLATLGVIFTTILTGLFIYWITSHLLSAVLLSLPVCFLLAATMSSTDSASVFNLLRSQNIKLKNNIQPLLELESGSNDPMAYMLTLMLIEYVRLPELSPWSAIFNLVVQFGVGVTLGFILGKVAVWFINKYKLSNQSLYPPLLLSFIFFTFSFTQLVWGNGYLAVYIAGIVLGNSKIIKRNTLQRFMDGVTWLAQIIMFLTLGLLVNPHEMIAIAPVAALVGIFMILLGRPLSVWLCLFPFNIKEWRSKCFVSWVGLRGAVPIIFATYPVVDNVAGADVIFNIVFFITLLSLLLQGTTITFFAKLLRLNEPMEKPTETFGMELPEGANGELHDILITDKHLINGNYLKDIELPEGALVLFVKRNEHFLIPTGKLEIHVNDVLLLVEEKEAK